jgi:hypothetical protein
MLGFFSRSVTLGICTIMPLLALGACSADKGEASPVDGEDAGSVEQGVTSDLACDDASFTGSITGGFLSDSPFIRVNKTPENYSAFNNDCYNPAANGECWASPGTSTRRLSSTSKSGEERFVARRSRR